MVLPPPPLFFVFCFLKSVFSNQLFVFYTVWSLPIKRKRFTVNQIRYRAVYVAVLYHPRNTQDFDPPYPIFTRYVFGSAELTAGQRGTASREKRWYTGFLDC